MKLPVIGFTLMIGSFSFYDTFIPELGQHLQHVNADLLRIIIETSADDTKAVGRQDFALYLVALIPPELIIFFVRYLLHSPSPR